MSKIRHFFQQSWLLITASFFFGLLIAATNTALAPRIIQNQKDKLDNLMRGLITNAVDFKVVISQAEMHGAKGKITKTDIYKALDKNDKIAGFAYITTGAGFADKIKLVIAVDQKCEKFFGFKVLSSNETPGFGDKIKKDYFADQFKKVPVGKMKLVRIGDDKKIDSQIVAITGATVSSEAVVKIVNDSVMQIKNLMQKEGFINNGQ